MSPSLPLGGPSGYGLASDGCSEFGGYSAETVTYTLHLSPVRPSQVGLAARTTV